VLALREKANKRHFNTLCALDSYLREEGWRNVEEIPAAIDLRARKPGAGRVLFEVKTITASNERRQVRSALAQLVEYRIFFGNRRDKLCLVTNSPIGHRRLQVLDELGIGHAYFERHRLIPSPTSATTAVF